jgi:hypothetical protein
MVETYSDYGYELIEVPRAPIEERVEFVIDEIRRSNLTCGQRSSLHRSRSIW